MDGQFICFILSKQYVYIFIDNKRLCWALEQVHIFFLGGSATASDFRLIWLSILGAANVAIVSQIIHFSLTYFFLFFRPFSFLCIPSSHFARVSEILT
jgi:hypothetical protein